MHAAVKLLRFIGAAALLLAQLGALGWICWAAVDIRMHAVNNYGRVSSATPYASYGKLCTDTNGN